MKWLSNPPMLCPSKTERSKRGRGRRIKRHLCLAENVAQIGCRDRHRHSGRVHVKHELVVFLDCRIAQQFIEHGYPCQRGGNQPVNHDHGIFPARRPDHQQIGPLQALLGPEQADQRNLSRSLRDHM